ncbi:hypothetical protein AC249_AIPGENE14321 [Exaiptasia diaphana]|nr:hypothetical protein AC249_AIPGENE14321 [Exaiptasia diaphana]
MSLFFPFQDFYKTAQVLNVAYKKKATAFPSTANHLRAVDGKSTTWSAGYCIDINNIKIRPWLEIDLEQEYLISDIFISVYKYGINDKRLYLQNFEIIISNETGNVNGSKCGEDLTLYKQSHGRFYCQDRPRGRYVRIASTLQNDKVESFGICEVEVEVLQVPGYWNATTAFPNYKGKKEFYRTGFVVNSRNCLSFSYLFNGSDPGRLNVNFSGAETLLWRFTGHHENNRWSIAQVPINADIAYQVVYKLDGICFYYKPMPIGLLGVIDQSPM